MCLNCLNVFEFADLTLSCVSSKQFGSLSFATMCGLVVPIAMLTLPSGRSRILSVFDLDNLACSAGRLVGTLWSHQHVLWRSSRCTPEADQHHSLDLRNAWQGEADSKFIPIKELNFQAYPCYVGIHCGICLRKHFRGAASNGQLLPRHCP